MAFPQFFRKPQHTLALVLAGSAALVTHTAWATQTVQFEPVLVAYRTQQADHRHAQRPSQRQSDRMRRDAPAVILPGVGQISDRLLRDLALDEAQTKSLTEARAAQRSLQQAQRTAMQEVRKLREQQLGANTLDPRALSQAQQTALTQVQTQRQAVQNQWLALWDSLTAQQRDKVVQAVKRGGDRRAQPQRERGRSRDARGMRG